MDTMSIRQAFPLAGVWLARFLGNLSAGQQLDIKILSEQAGYGERP
jgi:hypothetical protein